MSDPPTASRYRIRERRGAARETLARGPGKPAAEGWAPWALRHMADGRLRARRPSSACARPRPATARPHAGAASGGWSWSGRTDGFPPRAVSGRAVSMRVVPDAVTIGQARAFRPRWRVARSGPAERRPKRRQRHSSTGGGFDGGDAEIHGRAREGRLVPVGASLRFEFCHIRVWNGCQGRCTHPLYVPRTASSVPTVCTRYERLHINLR